MKNKFALIGLVPLLIAGSAFTINAAPHLELLKPTTTHGPVLSGVDYYNSTTGEFTQTLIAGDDYEYRSFEWTETATCEFVQIFPNGQRTTNELTFGPHGGFTEGIQLDPESGTPEFKFQAYLVR